MIGKWHTLRTLYYLLFRYLQSRWLLLYSKANLSTAGNITYHICNRLAASKCWKQEVRASTDDDDSDRGSVRITPFNIVFSLARSHRSGSLGSPVRHLPLHPRNPREQRRPSHGSRRNQPRIGIQAGILRGSSNCGGHGFEHGVYMKQKSRLTNLNNWQL